MRKLSLIELWRWIILQLELLYLRYVILGRALIVTPSNIYVELTPKPTIIPDIGYNPTETGSLEIFHPLKMQTPCIFARSSKLWGAPDWNDNASFEQNIENCKEPLQKFVDNINADARIDGFVIAIYYERLDDIVELCKMVKKSLCIMSSWTENDCMKSADIESMYWSFSALECEFFVTTFAPCYGPNHPRYAAGITECSFILLQPCKGFFFHKLPLFTLDTDYENPRNVRDQCRKSFKDKGQEYFVKDIPRIRFIIEPLDHSMLLNWWLEEPNLVPRT